ncbi:hypothetical protein [Desulfovibrio sp. ZJ369]|uniref:hypothetical protein n=1 Tax=Desulfovibrio sp. ZJ369 TaxID=2709793 RepID=UPI0013ED058A|nr:hypothetical protein [Desulfovibrio sp. ZJ369]
MWKFGKTKGRPVKDGLAVSGGGRLMLLAFAGQPDAEAAQRQNNQNYGNACVHRSALHASVTANPIASMPATKASGLLS